MLAILQLCWLVLPALAQKPATSCSNGLAFSSATPSAAPGYVVRLVANGLQDPRSIKFDNQGNLLVVESGKGVTALTFQDNGGDCLSVSQKTTVVSDSSLNHGLEISADGTQLYASNSDAVYRWRYNNKVTTSQPKTLVTNMTNGDHTTRTLLLSRFAPGVLVVTRGSGSNIDPQASIESSGHAQVKAFNLTNLKGTPFDFTAAGVLQAWGVRNDVGIDEHPVTGGVYTVENSVDQMTRNGVDIHNTNPSEELNFLGYLNGKKSRNQGRNFGYPQCYTAWDTSTIPQFTGQVGQQFAIGTLSKTNNDTMCSEAYRQAPALGFHPHMAPLDILFNTNGTEAWVTFHGSWDSDPPVGYKVSKVEFAHGKPTAPSTSNDAAIDIVTNAVDITQCPGSCFRPVGLAWDSQGRLFFSSDQTGEVYMVVAKNGKPIRGGTGSTQVSTTSASANAASPTQVNGNTVRIGLPLMLMQAVMAVL